MAVNGKTVLFAVTTCNNTFIAQTILYSITMHLSSPQGMASVVQLPFGSKTMFVDKL